MAQSRKSKQAKGSTSTIDELTTEIQRRGTLYKKVHGKLNPKPEASVDTLLHLCSLVKLNKLQNKLTMDSKVCCIYYKQV